MKIYGAFLFSMSPRVSGRERTKSLRIGRPVKNPVALSAITQRLAPLPDAHKSPAEDYLSAGFLRFYADVFSAEPKLQISLTGVSPCTALINPIT